MSRLINDLIKKGYLKSDSIIDAFSRIRRQEFIPEDLAMAADVDIPLPIGYGQTISQPLTVAFMLELLDPQPGQRILDVGSGSGWTTALLANIVGEKGHVTGIERIPELCKEGKRNVNKFGFIKKGTVEIHCKDGREGFEKNSPYDRILVSAFAEEVPTCLKEQMVIGGKMVIPIYNAIQYIEKRGKDDFYREEFKGFSFVPLVEESNN
jgi:protein-L-isoaspartate(D-aspartate) O-methyltransferase